MDPSLDPSVRQPRIEPPYGAILDELRLGKAVPFLGAGASRLAALDGRPSPLPSGSQLANLLADYSSFPSQDEKDRCDLAKVASYLVDGTNRHSLRRKLRTLFAGTEVATTRLHRLLARVADNLLIITTNYDLLLEQAFAEAGKPHDVVVYPADNREFANGVLWWRYGESEPRLVRSNDIDPDDVGRTNIIYKMHGSVRREAAEWDSFVITEEDYVSFLSRMRNAVPPAFRDYLSTRAFLFLGYGLQDWNLRVLLKQVSNPDMTSWAILQQPSLFEQSLWRRRKVDIFDMRLESFVEALEDRLGSEGM
jgi:hypothetical protein